MAAPALAPNSASRRSLPRYALDVSLDVIALQSGVPFNMPGRCCDLSEAGLGAVIAGELKAGQSIALELRLPNVGLPVRARALVRYQDRMRCGLQFVGLSAEQREKIRYWAAQSAAHAAPASRERIEVVPAAPQPAEPAMPGEEKSSQGIRARRRRFIVLVAFVIVLVALGWWQWQKSWNELEGESAPGAQTESGMPLRVSSETMDRLVLYKAEPVYPETARLARLQGLVVLDVVIETDGTVRRLRPLAGPEELSQAAMDAVRSWRYSPYRSQGQTVEVETTVGVDFRLP